MNHDQIAAKPVPARVWERTLKEQIVMMKERRKVKYQRRAINFPFGLGGRGGERGGVSVSMKVWGL